jgi:hypothetical protein
MHGPGTRLRSSDQLHQYGSDLHEIACLGPAVAGMGLRGHLIGDHGRSEREIDGLPHEDLHRFEHLEQAMGLTDLGHWHSAGGAPQGAGRRGCGRGRGRPSELSITPDDLGQSTC